MVRLRRPLVALALASTAAAMPAGAAVSPPELDLYPSVTALGKASSTDLDLTMPAGNPAPATLVVYVPTGYGMSVTRPVGTKVASVRAGAIAKATSATAVVAATGTLTADDPAKYAADPSAQACAPGTHAAAWTTTLTASGQTLPITFFVDPTAGPDTALGAFKLVACLPSPDVPVEQGGAPGGMQLVELELVFPDTFTNPPKQGVYVWRVYETPFTLGTATADPAQTVETNARNQLPQLLTLRAGYDAAAKKAVLSGRLVAEGKPRAGINVHFESAPKADARLLKPFGVARTGADGTFTFQKRALRTLYVYAFVNPYFGICTGATTAPGGCVRSTLSPPPPQFGRVTVPKG
jgi:hypothetical protein